MLAHAGAVDESLSVVLLFAALWVGWVGWSRWRGTGFERLPARAGPALLAAAVALVVAAAVVPPALFPATPGVASPTGARPSTSATLAFADPIAGAVLSGDEMRVVLDLRGGRIVDGASTEMADDAGHVHLSLDGRLVSMTFGLVQVVDLRSVSAGPHTLEAEFVAADHAPFDPRVRAVVRFERQDA